MRMRLRRAQTTDHGFNLPPAALASSGHPVAHAGPNHAKTIELEAAMKTQMLIDRYEQKYIVGFPRKNYFE